MNREFAFPGTRAKYGPDRVVDIKHLALAISVAEPAARTVAGTVTLTCSVLADGVRAVTLDAGRARDPRRARERLARRVPGIIDGKRLLRVELDGPLSIGAELVLAIEYRGSPRRGLYFIAPDDGYPHKPAQVWTQGQDEDSRYWFPCLDSPVVKKPRLR